jgi:serine/threonine-protein kinase RIO1
MAQAQSMRIQTRQVEPSAYESYGISPMTKPSFLTTYATASTEEQQRNSVTILNPEPSLNNLYNRIRYNKEHNTLLINMEGIQVKTVQHSMNVNAAVVGVLKSHFVDVEESQIRVHCLINYDDFHVADEVMEHYSEMVKGVQQKYYKTVARFTTSSIIAKQHAKLQTYMQQKDVEINLSVDARLVGNRYLVELSKEPSIGEGTYGIVYFAVCQQTGSKVAIKQLNKQRIEKLDMMDFVRREVRIMKRISSSTPRHPNVVQLLDFIETDRSMYLILEYCGGGPLESIHTEHMQYSEPQAKRYFGQMVSALRHLHNEVGILHRDLQLPNICLDDERDAIKICDFGMSQIFNKTIFYKDDEEPRMDKMTNYSSDDESGIRGNLYYASPEVLLGKSGKGTETDVWALGVCLYKMLTGFLPFSTAQKILMNTFTSPLDDEEDLSPTAKDLLQRIFVSDPTQRITIDAILEHPWLNTL